MGWRAVSTPFSRIEHGRADDLPDLAIGQCKVGIRKNVTRMLFDASIS
jgi:hypothetical protein